MRGRGGIALPPKGVEQSKPAVVSQDTLRVFEVQLVTVPTPSLTKARALALQSELLAAFTAARFQKKFHELERESSGDKDPSYRAAFRKLVRKEQSQVIPRYGFDASESGVEQMLAAFEEFKEDGIAG
ncbi:Ankrd17 [Symbiodinium sp. CCMP2592]|nr:Ankrd17 [Symbiodinium sp. CCMP2592]